MVQKALLLWAPGGTPAPSPARVGTSGQKRSLSSCFHLKSATKVQAVGVSWPGHVQPSASAEEDPKDVLHERPLHPPSSLGWLEREA